MTSTTVAEFANELKKSPDTLLEQLRSAGVAKSTGADTLSESDKQKLLGYLQASHGTVAADRKKITLTKKSTSEIKQADASGKARTIQVEIRKKRTFIKREDGQDGVASHEADDHEAAVSQSAVAAQAAEDAELVRREVEVLGQAEVIRQQEEALAKERQERESREKREREAEERAAAYAAQEVQKRQQATAEKAEASREYAAEAAARAQAQAEAREKLAEESKARAAEETARAVDLDARRRKA